MAVLLTVVLKEIGQTLALLAAKLAVEELNEYLDKIYPDSKDVRHVTAWYLLTFDQKFELRRIQSKLDDAVEQARTSTNTKIANLQAVLTFQKIDDPLHLLCTALENLTTADETSLHRRKLKFLNVCNQYNPEQLLVILHKDVTRTDVTGQFLTSIMESCDYPVFEQWCDCILLSAVKLCICMLVYVSVEAEMSQSVKENLSYVQTELSDAAKMVRHISETLKKSKTAARAKFFTGADSELMRLIDRFYDDICEKEPMKNNQICAELLGTTLSEKYNWFTWAVIVAEDTWELRNFLLYSGKDSSNLFLAESVHSKLVPWITPNGLHQPSHRVISSGLDCGVIVCRKKYLAFGGQRRLLAVFWKRTDRTVFPNTDWLDISLQLSDVHVPELVPVSDDVIVEELLVAQNVQFENLQKALSSQGLCYVVCLGVCKARQQVRLGSYPKETVNFESEVRWPFHIRNRTESGHLFVWPVLSGTTEAVSSNGLHSAETEHIKDAPILETLPLDPVLAVTEERSLVPESKTLFFSGLNWKAHSSGQSDPVNAFVDEDGRLHLRLVNNGIKWYGAEVTTDDSFGFGRYQFHIEFRLDLLDPNVVFAVTSQSEEDQTHIGIRFAKCGSETVSFGVGNPNNSESSSTSADFSLDKFAFKETYTTHSYSWNRESVTFRSQHGHQYDNFVNEFFNSGCTGADGVVIPAEPMPVSLTLCLKNDQRPMNSQSLEIIIHSFEFRPTPVSYYPSLR